jgi:hypothetical protein
MISWADTALVKEPEGTVPGDRECLSGKPSYELVGQRRRCVKLIGSDANVRATASLIRLKRQGP